MRFHARVDFLLNEQARYLFLLVVRKSALALGQMTGLTNKEWSRRDTRDSENAASPQPE